MDQFVHLHSHTEFSLLDGKSSIDSLVRETVRLGQSAVAVTDHGSLGGAFQLWKTATAAGVKPIIGCEFYVAPHDRHWKHEVYWGHPGGIEPGVETTGDIYNKRQDISGAGKYTHLTVLATSTEGLRNLCRLQYVGYTEGFYRKPRIDDQSLIEHQEGLVVLSGCAGSALSTRLRLGHSGEAEALARRYKESLGDKYYIEIMSHGISNDDLDDDLLNHELQELARKLDIPVVVTNDNHYTLESEKGVHDALLCVQTHSVLGDSSQFGSGFSGDGYFLRSRHQMQEVFPTNTRALDETLRIAERVGDYSEFFEYDLRMPHFSDDERYDLARAVEYGLNERFGGQPPQEYLAQAEYEVDTFNSLGFPGYFLTTQQEVNDGRSRGIRIGPGRGSVCGSLVAWCLGITEIDPIAHGLMFERFINPQRVSLPDIDIDVDDSRRDEFIGVIRERYGHEHVAQIGTYGVMKARKSLKAAASVLFGPSGYAMGEQLCKSLPPDKFGRSAPLEDGNFGWVSQSASQSQYESILELARGLEGTVHNESIHAGGVVISPTPLCGVLPVRNSAGKGGLITSWDMHEIESLGLIKKDYLGLVQLGIIESTLKMLRERGITVDLPTDPKDLTDAATFQLLQRGETLGVFQLDSAGMRRLLRDVCPTRFGDISAVLALFRPGPMGVKAHQNYALRKNQKQSISYIHPELEEDLRPILEDTYGLVVYQEQVLKILAAVGRYTYATADNIFYAMRKKIPEKLQAEKPELFRRMAENGYSSDACESLWDVLLPFADYSFNKSHTVGYGIIAYWTAYLKANYPHEYMCALLTQETKPEKAKIYLEEITRMNIAILPPDINESSVGWTPTSKGIRYGLGTIRGVGEATILQILRRRPYRSLDDFFRRVDKKILNIGTLEAFIKCGSLDGLTPSREGLASVSECLSLRALRDRANVPKGQHTLWPTEFDVDDETPRDTGTRQSWEREYLGIPLTQPTVTLRPKRRLSEIEWEYVKRIVESTPGPSSVRVDLGGRSVDLAHRIDGVAFAQYISSFGLLDIEEN